MGHTPGPWFVNDDCIEAGGPEGPRDVTVAMVTGSTNPREANARLISAAPDLLHACQAIATDCERVLDGDDFSGMSDADLFRAFLDTLGPAIAKAEGRSE
jgi:hypothetical protein